MRIELKFSVAARRRIIICVGLTVVSMALAVGCRGKGGWNQNAEVERARFSAERSMIH